METLNNGAVVIHSTPQPKKEYRLCLCKWREDWVVWIVGGKNVSCGHYFRDFFSAVDYYKGCRWAEYLHGVKR